MMKNFRNLMCLIIILAMMMAIFAGCGSNAPETEDSLPEDNASVSDNSSLADNDGSTDVSDSAGENSNTVSEDNSAPDVSADNSESSDVVSEDASEDVSDEVSNDVSDDVSVPVEHTHTYTVSDSKEATCTEKGYVIKKCTCGSESREEIAALGHKKSDWIVITEATTQIDGIKRKYCTRCDEMLEEKTISRIEENTSFDTEVSDKPVHAFKSTVVDPTCTEEGYTVDECSCCGVYSKYNIVDALGHKKSSPWVTVKEATTSATGLKEQKCSRCGVLMASEVIPQLGKYDVIATEENTALVEERVLYYINQYRVQEGACAMILSGEGTKSRNFARGRAVQLVTNYAHDTNDIRNLATELQFGTYKPEQPESYYDWETDEIIYTGNMIPAYYQPPGSEAIGNIGYINFTIDELGKKIALICYESKSHWDYIGDDANAHIAIGLALTGNRCYVCLFAMQSQQYD